MITRIQKEDRILQKALVEGLLSAFCLLHPALALAGSPGTTTGELLKIPVGTRAIGMGEAYTAMADDTSALYWNPAGMSLLHQKEANFSHSALMDSVHYENLSFVAPGDTYAYGTQFSYLGY